MSSLTESTLYQQHINRLSENKCVCVCIFASRNSHLHISKYHTLIFKELNDERKTTAKPHSIQTTKATSLDSQKRNNVVCSNPRDLKRNFYIPEKQALSFSIGKRTSVLAELAITFSQLSCFAKYSLAIPIDTGWSRKDKAQIFPLIPKLSIKRDISSTTLSPHLLNYSKKLCSCSKNLPHYRLSHKEWSNIIFSIKNKKYEVHTNIYSSLSFFKTTQDSLSIQLKEASPNVRNGI